MSAPYVLTFDVGPSRDAWCDGCMTSSLVVCDVTSIGESGVSVIATYRECWRCEGKSND